MSAEGMVKDALERAARRAERVALMDVAGGSEGNDHEGHDGAGADQKRPRTRQLILCWGLSPTLWERKYKIYL